MGNGREIDGKSFEFWETLDVRNNYVSRKQHISEKFGGNLKQFHQNLKRK